MSLDISLYEKTEPKICVCPFCNDEHFGTGKVEVFEANITHNLGKMASEAGLYKVMWRPEEIGVKYAKDAIEHLKTGIAQLRSDPDHFKTFNPDNGWGDYDGLLCVAISYLDACEQYPDTEIDVSI